MTDWPTSEEWSPEIELAAFTSVLAPGNIAVLVLNFFGVVTFYAFRSNRRFPVTVLAWVAILNTLYSCVLVAKWSNSSKARGPLLLGSTGSASVCLFSLWVDTFYYYALVTLNLLIALTLYLTICKRKVIDYDTNPRYLWFYIGFFWTIMIVVPISIAYSPGVVFLPEEGACQVPSPLVYADIVPQALMVAFQIFFVASSLRYAREIINAARETSRTKRDLRLSYMLVRFTLTIFLQFVEIVVYYSGLMAVAANPSLFYHFITVTSVLAPCLDACVLIFGNRPLLKWVFAFFPSGFFESSESTHSHELSHSVPSPSTAPHSYSARARSSSTHEPDEIHIRASAGV